MPHSNKVMISFFLTTRCNLRCIYCYNRAEREQKREQTLPFDFSKAGINWFFKNFKSRHIRFYGPGEPTQEFTLLKNIINYAKAQANGNLLVEMQTNGAFNTNVCKWISKNINVVWVSFDGPPDIQNRNRPLANGAASSPIIEGNVRFLTEKQKNKLNVVGARVTITHSNVRRQNEMVDYFYSLGIKYIWTDPLFSTVDDIPTIEKVEQCELLDLDEYVDYFVDAYNYSKGKGIFYGSFFMCNFDGLSKYHCRACLPVPHLTPDGYISACDMVTFGETPHHMKPFVYGKWNAQSLAIEFDKKRIDVLKSRSIKNMPGCKGCPVKDHCVGYCLGEVLNETGSLFGKKKNHCKAIIRLAQEIGFFEKQFPFLHP